MLYALSSHPYFPHKATGTIIIVYILIISKRKIYKSHSIAK